MIQWQYYLCYCSIRGKPYCSKPHAEGFVVADDHRRARKRIIEELTRDGTRDWIKKKPWLYNAEKHYWYKLNGDRRSPSHPPNEILMVPIQPR